MISFRFTPACQKLSLRGASRLSQPGCDEAISSRSRKREIAASFGLAKTAEKTPLTGDIYIAAGRSKRQAKEAGHAWDRELAYLVIHGILHLLGYTDYTTRERRRMFQKQDKVFQCLFS